MSAIPDCEDVVNSTEMSLVDPYVYRKLNFLKSVALRFEVVTCVPSASAMESKSVDAVIE